MAFSIVRHAFVMVFGNFGQALRLSAGPLAIAVIVIYALSRSLSVGAVSVVFMAMNPARADPVVLLVVLAGLAVMTFATAWIAVAWHRFILVEEYVTLLPRLRGRPVGRYILMSLAIAFWVFLASFAAAFVAGILLAITGQDDNALAGFIAGTLIGVVSSYVWFRLALVLPALAILTPMSLKASFAQTRPISSTIVQVVLILVVINLILQAVIGQIAPGSPAVQVTLGGIVTWLSFMIGLSVLTTFYGHLVEGRALADQAPTT